MERIGFVSRRAGALGLLMATLWGGCGGGKESALPSVGMGWVEGRVVSSTGLGVEGAEVELEGWTLRVFSDARGMFRLRAPEGRHWLRASAVLQARRWAGEAGPITVEPGRTATGIVLQLRDITDEPPLGHIAGGVFDWSGDILIGAEVQVEGRPETKVFSGVRGGFLLPNLPAGTYTLLASALTPDGRRLEGRRSGVEVRAGQTTSNVNLIAIPEGMTGTLAGRVLSATGTPVAEATVGVSLDVDWLTTRTDTTGSYTLPGVPATLEPLLVLAMAPGFDQAVAHLTVPAGGVRERNFTLVPSRDGLPSAPFLSLVNAITYPRAVTPLQQREYGALREAVYRRWAPGKAELWRKARSFPSLQRRWPEGGLVEIDVFWEPLEQPNVGGYWVYRSLLPGEGYFKVVDVSMPTGFFAADMGVELTVGNRYYYRVRAYTNRRQEGDFSDAATTVPLGMLSLLAPPPGTPSAPTNPEFRWEPLAGAKAYVVVVFEQFPSARIAPLWQSDPLPEGRTRVLYTGPTLVRGRTYYWVVAAYNDTDLERANAESWSEIAAFTVAP